jgi:CRISPR system Cascade subunit CasE
MFLTRFRFNPARTGARRLLASPHRLHGAVAAAFAEPAAPSASGEPRVLWRLDHSPRRDIVLYIASPHRPDLTHLVEQAGWPTTQQWQTFDYSPFLDKLAEGDVWNFRLTANPVHSIRRTDSEPTKRTAHLTPKHQVQWLLNQQERSGFAIEGKAHDPQHLPDGDDYQLVAHDQRTHRFSKPGSAPGQQVTVATVVFDGRLRITDAAAIRRTLTAGLGKAKAYGCGLMTLGPAD